MNLIQIYFLFLILKLNRLIAKLFLGNYKHKSKFTQVNRFRYRTVGDISKI